jgi:hypothetical protein
MSVRSLFALRVAASRVIEGPSLRSSLLAVSTVGGGCTRWSARRHFQRRRAGRQFFNRWVRPERNSSGPCNHRASNPSFQRIAFGAR